VDHPDTEPDWKRITTSFTDEVYPHYNFVWEHMEEPARESLQQLAADKATGKKYDYINEDLVRSGYLRDSDGKLVFSSSVWRRFVVEKGGKGGPKRSFLGSLFGRGGQK
jgi:hypothetical protein